MISRKLFAIVLSVGLGFVMQIGLSAPASAAGCYGTGCDRLWPKENGCFVDAKVIAGVGDSIQVRYSPSCRAVWTYRTTTPVWSKQLHLEMEKLVDGQWVRVDAIYGPNSIAGPEWTTMFGARTTNFRFRGLNVDPFDGSFSATPWVRGGSH